MSNVNFSGLFSMNSVMRRCQQLHCVPWALLGKLGLVLSLGCLLVVALISIYHLLGELCWTCGLLLRELPLMTSSLTWVPHSEKSWRMMTYCMGHPKEKWRHFIERQNIGAPSKKTYRALKCQKAPKFVRIMGFMRHVSAHKSELQKSVIFETESGHICK